MRAARVVRCVEWECRGVRETILAGILKQVHSKGRKGTEQWCIAVACNECWRVAGVAQLIEGGRQQVNEREAAGENKQGQVSKQDREERREQAGAGEGARGSR